MSQFIQDSLQEAFTTIKLFIENKENITLMDKAISLMTESLKSNGRIYSCGNGGSMCDAMHFAEELTGRFRDDRKAVPAMAISDPSHLSCVSNDYGYEFVFSRFLEGWGNEGDCLLAISTSGNSKNILRAVEYAKVNGIKTIGLLGKGGGQLKDMVDIPLVVPSSVSDRVQEVHIKIIHTFIEGIERTLYPENYNN
ncbi:MAG: D-sedoheptulose 7-phosphate isomerase [Deltaproteobacteria bacterium]|nr:MAG: D-sedoheptulose 7-phosphate isomerase [Deltaproteobacteria bacterium]TNF27576.1 MAG: D-sedoheptulose 7-phosphate isomerase [Deltaproteobacteria bacterium]